MNRRKVFGFIFTFCCTAACKHCCFSCSPSRSEKIEIDLVKHILNSPYFIHDFKTVFFSGGELFLYYDEIIDLMNIAKIHFEIQCATNGFWGEEFGQAEKIIKKLKKVGLTKLLISYDEYHSEFIPPSSIQNILILCKRYLLDVEIQCTVCKKSWRIAETSRMLLENITEISISESAVLMIGNARNNFNENDLIYENQKVNDRCLGADAITIFPDGSVYSCCSPVGYSIPHLKQGKLTIDMDDRQMQQVVENDILFRNLVKYGISGTCKRRWPLKEIWQKERYVNVCDICYHFLSQIPLAEEDSKYEV